MTTLCHHQFGFRQHHSMTQQLLIFPNNALNNCPKCDLIYLNFKRAFDSVPQLELLLKLWKVGVVGSLWRWFCEYLSNRYQQVCINSSTLPVISGVPQGSLLGPLLFLIYINDSPAALKHSESFLFADDTKCLLPICPPHDCIQLQSDLNALTSWSTDWKLMFNETRCLHLLSKVNTCTSLTNDQSLRVTSKRPWHHDIRITVCVPCHSMVA